MNKSRYECDPEAVLDMQAHHVGVEEILQYCHALMTHGEVERLLQGLETILERLGGGMSEAFADDLAMPSILETEEELVT